MRAESIAQERQQVVRDLRKQELGREKLQHDRHELAERMRSNVAVKQEWHGGQVAVKESKSVDLTEAREAHVTGE
jgi:signal transduction histidine kinase